MLAAAVLLIVCGGIVHGLSDDPVEVAGSGELIGGGPQGSKTGNNFAPGENPQNFPDLGNGDRVEGAAEDSQPWSPALFRGGFGLFLGFSIGIALRLFLKILGVVVGAQLLMLFLFSYLGWVEVHWDAIDQHVKGWFASWGEEFASFKRFVTGHLPSTGLAAVGTWAGWRRN